MLHFMLSLHSILIQLSFFHIPILVCVQITDALGHVESCLEYMSRLRQPNVFRFCAIPQVCVVWCVVLADSTRSWISLC
jgi:uncharacterized membrane protein